MPLALDTGWIVGWSVGAAVVVVAAVLLLVVISLGRRIVRQAEDITRALEGTRENTAPMFDLAVTNLAIDRLVRGLARLREDRSG